MPFVANAGVRIFYEDVGAGDPVCVLVHGWCCDHTAMEPLAADLSARHRVLNLDLRGAGASDRPDRGYAMADMAGDVLAVAEMANARVVLVGHSMGGRVALAAATSRPALVRAVVLLDSAISEDPAYVANRRAELDGADAVGRLRIRFARLFPFGAPTPDALDTMLRTPEDVRRGTLDGSDAFDAGAALRAWRGPVLYIGASRPRHDSAAVWAIAPDALYGQVVRSGHFVQHDGRTQVSAMLEALFGMVPAD